MRVDKAESLAYRNKRQETVESRDQHRPEVKYHRAKEKEVNGKGKREIESS